MRGCGVSVESVTVKSSDTMEITTVSELRRDWRWVWLRKRWVIARVRWDAA